MRHYPCFVLSGKPLALVERLQSLMLGSQAGLEFRVPEPPAHLTLMAPMAIDPSILRSAIREFESAFYKISLSPQLGIYNDTVKIDLAPASPELIALRMKLGASECVASIPLHVTLFKDVDRPGTLLYWIQRNDIDISSMLDRSGYSYDVLIPSGPPVQRSKARM